MKELISTTDPTIIALVKHLLESEHIKVFEMDVHMSNLEGSIGIFPKRLFVLKKDLTESLKILTDNQIQLKAS
jgi:hypothetical protein